MSLGRYQAYPEYRDSGEDWIGHIPRSWSAVPLKRVCGIHNGATPKSGIDSFWDGEIPWVTPADLGKDTTPYISTGARSISKLGFQSCATSLVPKDSVILSSRAPIGTLGIARRNLCTNQGCKSLVVASRYDFKFFYYYLSISSVRLNVLGRGSTFLEISSEELGNYKICAPPLPEQTQIAAFLDHETAKIDRLIEKQEALIRLLKEKRQAVISHAVTKGLNPHAPLKDSGIEWLGQVPAHWRVLGLGKVVDLMANGSSANQIDEAPNTVAVTRIESISGGNLNFEKVGYVRRAEILSEYLLQPGDILFSNINSLSMVGNCAIYEGQRELYAGMNLLRIRPTASMADSRYMLHQFRAKFFRNSVEASAKPAINQASIPTGTLRQLSFVCPPIEEQILVVKFVDAELGTMDLTIAKATEAITLMQERRTALISAAVTGKIDVRHWQPPAP